VLGAGAAVRLSWFDGNGLFISTTTGVAVGSAGTVARATVTATPPPNAGSCQLAALNTVQAARPALTWTDRAYDWADGQGCPQAVIHAPSRSLVMASTDPRGGRYSNISYTVQEVG
jgi:hypothetical protein